jgi:hypothetical protein
MDVDNDRPPDTWLQHIRAFESETNPEFVKLRLWVSATMRTTVIHRLPMNWTWIKAPELPGAEQHEHGKILHPRIQIAPRNGCLTDGLRG